MDDEFYVHGKQILGYIAVAIVFLWLGSLAASESKKSEIATVTMQLQELRVTAVDRGFAYYRISNRGDLDFEWKYPLKNIKSTTEVVCCKHALESAKAKEDRLILGSEAELYVTGPR